MRNLLATHLTNWKWWYCVLPIMALVLGSWVSVLLALAPLQATTQALLASPMPLIAAGLLGLGMVALLARQWPGTRQLALTPVLTRGDIGLILVVFVLTHLLFWLLSVGIDTSDQASTLFAEMQLGRGTANDLAVLLAAVLAAPVVEEVLYRGLLMRSIHDHLARRGHLRAAAIIALAASTLAFAMPHLGEAENWRFVVAYLITGLAFGIVYLRTGSLTAAMVAHAMQSMYAFGSVLLFGRGDAQVSPLAWLLVFGAPLWVYLIARAMHAVMPKEHASP